MARDKITLKQLEEKLADPDVPESELRQYLTFDKDSSGAFAPAVAPDPAKVEVETEVRGAALMEWANGAARRRRQRRFRRRFDSGENLPILVSEGDSWFQFPILLDDVIDQLGDEFLIWSLDAAGDTLDNMVVQHPEYLSALDEFANINRGFLFSGAGNDIVGEDPDGTSVIEKIVRPFDTAHFDAAWYIDTPGFADRLDFVEDCYRRMLRDVTREHPALPIIAHGYDYSIPGGNPGEWRAPRYADVDEWLGKPLRALGIVDVDLQNDIVRAMIDRLNEMQIRLCGGTNPDGEFARAFHVDARGVVGHDWNDELHPTDVGYRKVAMRFRMVLAQALNLV